MSLKKILTLLSLYLCLCMSFAQTGKTLEEFIEQYHLNPESPLAAITLKTIDITSAFGKDIENPESTNEVVIFNYQGDKISKTFFNDMKISSQYQYNYDEQGNIIESTLYNANGAISQFSELMYDEKNRLTQEIVYDFSGKLAFRVEGIYDDDDNLIEELRYDKDDALIAIAKHIYDEQGNQIESNYKNLEAKPPALTNTNQNFVPPTNPDGNQNQPIAQTAPQTPPTLLPSGVPAMNQRLEAVTKIKYRYDSKGNKLTEAHFSKSGTLNSTWEFEYDENSNMTRNSYRNLDSSFNYTIEDNRNANGDIVDSVKFDSAMNVVSTIYCSYEDFDKYLNWQKRSCFRYSNIFGKFQRDYNGYLNEIEIREFLYHDSSGSNI